MDVYHAVRNRLHQHRVVAADTAVEALDELRQMMELHAADLNTGGRDNANMDALPRNQALVQDANGLLRLLTKLSEKVKTD